MIPSGFWSKPPFLSVFHVWTQSNYFLFYLVIILSTFAHFIYFYFFSSFFPLCQKCIFDFYLLLNMIVLTHYPNEHQHVQKPRAEESQLKTIKEDKKQTAMRPNEKKMDDSLWRYVRVKRRKTSKEKEWKRGMIVNGRRGDIELNSVVRNEGGNEKREKMLESRKQKNGG